MPEYQDQVPKHRSNTATEQVAQHKAQKSSIAIADNRPEAIAQRKILALSEQSHQNTSPMQTKSWTNEGTAQLFTMGGINTMTGAGNAVVQRFSAPNILRFHDLKVGRAQNAGIVDEAGELGTGVKYIRHFHCNNWDEDTKTFNSFTGTFVLDGSDTKYHYTIIDGGASGWVGGAPPDGAMAFKFQTIGKLEQLTAAEE